MKMESDAILIISCVQLYGFHPVASEKEAVKIGVGSKLQLEPWK